MRKLAKSRRKYSDITCFGRGGVVFLLSSSLNSILSVPSDKVAPSLIPFGRRVVPFVDDDDAAAAATVRSRRLRKVTPPLTSSSSSVRASDDIRVFPVKPPAALPLLLLLLDDAPARNRYTTNTT
jgi:hypothetical protein